MPDYYLETDNETMQQYCKLAKYNYEDKYKQAVEAIVKSGKKAERKSSLSLKSKVFLPKSKAITNQLEMSLVNANRKFSHGNPTLGSSL